MSVRRCARRHRVHVQAPAQAAHAVGLAEGAFAGGEVVEHDTQGEQVAAGVVADVLHLLGRHVGAGAHGQRELFVQQVGQVVVARQAEVHQHRGAIGAEHDVAGLHVQVHQVLAVQVVQRGGHARADLDHLVQRQRGFVQARAQAVAVDALHHDVGLAREVALGHEVRHVRAAEHGHDHLLDLEADDGGRVLAALDARHLHDQRLAGVAMVVHPRDAPYVGHAALVQALFQHEAVHHLAGGDAAGHVHGAAGAVAQRVGQPARRAVGEAAVHAAGRGLGVIGHRTASRPGFAAGRPRGSWRLRLRGRRARGGRSACWRPRRTSRSRRPGCRRAAGRPSRE